jgi:hypothetical protein
VGWRQRVEKSLIDHFWSTASGPAVPSVTGTTSIPPTTSPTTGTLDYVKASLDTASGRIASARTRLPDNRINLKVTIPDNTTATVWVPTQSQGVASPAGAQFLGDQSIGADTALGGRSSQYAVYKVGPGTWEWNRN